MKPDLIREDVALCTYTTLGVGGPVEYFADVSTLDDLRSVIGWANEQSVQTSVLSGGSNILVSDGDIKGLALKVSVPGITITEKGDTVYVTSGAGVCFDELVAGLVESEIYGLENLSGVPGSVGAVPIQNVGAYGVEAKDRIASVVAYDGQEDTFVVFSNTECNFSYRNSYFKTKKGKRYIVVFVTFTLSRTLQPVLAYRDLGEYFRNNTHPSASAIREAVLSIRSTKFPDVRTARTAGSFFKNPVVPEKTYEGLRARFPNMPGFPEGAGYVKIPLGYVLDKVLGLKGYREGDVGLYDKQALVLVNYGNATAQEIDAFARMIEQKVFEAIGISIEREVTSIQ